MYALDASDGQTEHGHIVRYVTQPIENESGLN